MGFNIQHSNAIAKSFIRDIEEAVEDILWESTGTNGGIIGFTNASKQPNRFYLEVRANEVLFMSNNKEIYAFGFWHEEGRHRFTTFLEYDDLFILKEAYGYCTCIHHGLPLFGSDKLLVYPPAYRALLVVKKVLSELLEDKGNFKFPFE